MKVWKRAIGAVTAGALLATETNVARLERRPLLAEEEKGGHRGPGRRRGGEIRARGVSFPAPEWR